MAEADPTIAEATQTSLPVRQPALDGVRAVAVMLVLAAHANLFKLGGLGVDIFFGLSGYLITGILLDAKAAHPSKRDYFVPFYMRRALRILPLAWAVALIAAAIEGQWSGLLWYMGYLVNWLPNDPPPDVLGHYWSLAVEEQFYLVWPAVVLFAPRREASDDHGRGDPVRHLCRFDRFDVAARLRQLLSFSAFATFARADTLAVGALLAQLERIAGTPCPAHRLGVGRGARCGGRHFGSPSAGEPGPGAAADLQPEMADRRRRRGRCPSDRPGPAPGLPPMVLDEWIGQISYGVYVIHALLSRPLHARFDSPVVVFVLLLGLTLPLAALSWYFFEAPILAQKHRWPMPSARRG